MRPQAWCWQGKANPAYRSESMLNAKRKELLPSLGLRPHLRSLTFFMLAVPVLAGAQVWGPPVNGLRLALGVENEVIVVTVQNVNADREMYLPLGRAVGIGRAEFVEIQ